MPKATLLKVLMLFIANLASAQPPRAITDSVKVLRSYVTLRNNPIPLGGGAVVSGKLFLSSDRLDFNPSPCRPPSRFVETISTCINDLVSPVSLPFEEIKHIRRRNYLLIFPNRIHVTKHNGKAYNFFTYKRGLVIRTFKEYQARPKAQAVRLGH